MSSDSEKPAEQNQLKLNHLVHAKPAQNLLQKNLKKNLQNYLHLKKEFLIK